MLATAIDKDLASAAGTFGVSLRPAAAITAYSEPGPPQHFHDPALCRLCRGRLLDESVAISHYMMLCTGRRSPMAAFIDPVAGPAFAASGYALALVFCRCR